MSAIGFVPVAWWMTKPLRLLTPLGKNSTFWQSGDNPTGRSLLSISVQSPPYWSTGTGWKPSVLIAYFFWKYPTAVMVSPEHAAG